jgi:pimeloyl-ACP methyl ester carboxylesterase
MTTILSESDAPWFESLRKRPHAFHALRADPRVSFTLYVPAGFFQDPTDYSLIVSVHGSGRNAHAYRDAFMTLADNEKCVVLAPLFPVGVCADGFSDGYKYLAEQDCRYDLLLLHMVTDVQEALAFDFGKFYLFGFSGGGQFAHRFFYLHPHTLAGVSIGAPGICTRLDNSRKWWFGTQDLVERFNIELDLPALRRVKVQLVVGDCDLEEFIIPQRLASFVSGLGNIGRNRVERINLLKEHYDSVGIDSQLDIVAGVAHEGLKVTGTVQAFFKGLLK